MIHSITIFAVLLLGFVGSANAAPMAGDTITDAKLGMQFVWVPKGCFKMGAIKAVARKKLVNFNGVDGEYVHEHKAIDGFSEQETCLKKGFWMGKYEVTQGQYSSVAGRNPSAFKKGNNYPVEKVRWIDVQRFIRKINKQTGKNYRLPSEAEWEYAARSGGKKQKYTAAGGPDDSSWYMNNSDNSSHPVGRKQANALGIYDMSGNVWEWTQDCLNTTGVKSAPTDGSARLSGICSIRILRGGSWYDVADFVTTTSRLWNDTDKTDNNSGFRLVRD